MRNLRIYTDWIDNGTDTPRSFIIIAAKGERDIGYLQFTPGEDSTTIDGLDVEPEYRRKGIATLLYETATVILGKRPTHSDSLSDFGSVWKAAMDKRDKKLARSL